MDCLMARHEVFPAPAGSASPKSIRPLPAVENPLDALFVRGVDGGLFGYIVATLDSDYPWPCRPDLLADNLRWRELPIIDGLGMAKQVVALMLERLVCVHRSGRHSKGQYALFEVKVSDEGLYVGNVAVRPSVKGRGIGRLLLELAETEASPGLQDDLPHHGVTDDGDLQR
jgi:GNAT superfamily N-acetyltransferase